VRRYLEVWRLPGARRLIVAGIIGRLPIAMVPLALLLLVEDQTGSYAKAGIAVGIYSAALASVAPILGRIADRFGPRPVLLATGVSYPLLLLGLLGAIDLGAPVWAIYAAAALAGTSVPLLSSSLRVLWLQLARGDEAVRQSAYALESVAVEGVFVGGPVVVAGFVAFADPGLAIATAAALAFLGTVSVALSGPARQWRRHPDTTPTTGAGPLRSPGMVVLLTATAALMFGFGTLEVAVPAFADGHDSEAMSGLLLAVWALGSGIGGIWFGTRKFAISMPAQLRYALLAVAIGMTPLAFAGDPWILGFLLFLGGSAIAPTMIVQNGLVADLAPAGTTTEAFTWFTTVAFGTSALGSAVGGLVVDRPAGVAAAFALAALSALLAWAVVTVPGTGLTRGVATEVRVDPQH
jgi:MFS family permease